MQQPDNIEYKAVGIEPNPVRSNGVAALEIPERSKAGAGVGNTKRTASWMRDPATGDWIPENHFGQIDIAVDIKS